MTSNRPVAIFPSRTWGPRPRWALVPLAGVAAVVATLPWSERPVGGQPTVVTAFKPAADGGPVPSAPSAMPIEVVHGVPSPATLHLWLPRRGESEAPDDAG